MPNPFESCYQGANLASDTPLISNTLSTEISRAPLNVTAHGAEIPLRVAIWVASIWCWILIVISVVGSFYAMAMGAFALSVHVALAVRIRGSAVRLSEQQFPDLYRRIVALSERIGLPVPDAYLMQSGGAINAFATKFFGSHFIVLYSDLIAACGNNEEALDFIVAHELGHLHRGHLKRWLLLLPGRLIPLLGSAYSRACEYTCDRYGAAATSHSPEGLEGLVILAAGGQFAPNVNRLAFAQQTQQLDTVLMNLGQWFGTHPPLVKRLIALDSSLRAQIPERKSAATASAVVLVGMFLCLCLGSAFAASKFVNHVNQIVEQQKLNSVHREPPTTD